MSEPDRSSDPQPVLPAEPVAEAPTATPATTPEELAPVLRKHVDPRAPLPLRMMGAKLLVPSSPSDAACLRKETNEAAWLLGVQLLVQVVPGPGDRVLGVLAGDAAAVRARGRAWLEEAWRYEVSQRVGVVVASIEGGPEQQGWENVARALETAAAALADEGVIALCTSLARPPGPALRQLASGHPSAPRRKSGQAVPPDVLPAAILDEIGKQYRVFLLSDLDEETVEELGMGYIASPHEIMRLVRQFDSCLVLGNAHHAIIQVVD